MHLSPSFQQVLDLALPLVAAHLVGDFWFQTGWMVKHKRRVSVLALHAAIVAALSYLFVGRWSLWVVPLLTWVTHAGIDSIKCRIQKPTATAFTLDQLAHLAVIVLLAVGIGQASGETSQWTVWWGASWRAFLIGISGVTLSVRVGGMLIGYWVQPYLDEIQQAAALGTAPLRETRGLTNGGRLIGQWERALIFLFVLLAQPASIGFLIAAKSIFRFGELKDRENRMEAEYITIGTLMSFGWALVVSYGTWWALRAG